MPAAAPRKLRSDSVECVLGCVVLSAEGRSRGGRYVYVGPSRECHCGLNNQIVASQRGVSAVMLLGHGQVTCALIASPLGLIGPDPQHTCVLSIRSRGLASSHA